MSLGEMGVHGAVRRVAVAVTHGNPPEVVLATDDIVLSRAIALKLVAQTDPASFDPAVREDIRAALLEERWPDAVVAWMDASGEVIDAYPDEPVWSDHQLDEERTSFELRTAPIFRG